MSSRVYLRVEELERRDTPSGVPFARRQRAGSGGLSCRPELMLLEDRVAPVVSLLNHFDGIGFTGFLPPDTHAAAGPSHLVEVVNNSIGILDKATGAFVHDYPQTLSNFFSVFSIDNADFTHPSVIYDEDAGRFVITAVAINNRTETSFLLVAVSNSSDPTAGFSEQQKIDVAEQSSSLWGDYPKLGRNANAIVVTMNMYTFPAGANSVFDHVQIVTLDKSSLLDADPATLTKYQVDRFGGHFSMTPAVMHIPTTREPMWLVEAALPPDNMSRVNEINLISMENGLSNSPAFTNHKVTVEAYGLPLPAAQLGFHGFLDTGDPRILNAESRRGKLVAAHTVGIGKISDGSDTATARWYEFNTEAFSNSKKLASVLLQQGNVDAVFANASTWCPSISIRPDGSLGMTFLESTLHFEFLSMYVTGQATLHPKNAMQKPVLAKAGQASYQYMLQDETGKLFDPYFYRTGAYSATCMDPVDGSFWAANQYATSTIWGTQLVNFNVFLKIFPIFPIEAAAGARQLVSVFNDGGNPIAPTVASPSSGDMPFWRQATDTAPATALLPSGIITTPSAVRAKSSPELLDLLFAEVAIRPYDAVGSEDKQLITKRVPGSTAMRNRVYLRVEELERRDTPSGTPVASGAFLPPGLDRAYGTGIYVPAPVKLAADGSVAFLPPGSARTAEAPAPRPVHVGEDGTVTFLPPAFQGTQRNAPHVVMVRAGGSISIQDAVNSVADGGMVIVGPGRYDEAITITKRVDLIGQIRGDQWPEIFGPRPSQLVPAELATGAVNYIGGGGSFRNFRLRGHDNGIVGYDRDRPPTRVDISHVEISETGRGILWRSAADLTGNDIHITDILGNGFSWTGQDLASLDLKKVFLSLIGGIGLPIFNSGDPVFVSGPPCSPSYDGPRIEIKGAVILSAKQGGIVVFGGHKPVCIEDCLLVDNAYAGIRLMGAGFVHIANSFILFTLPRPSDGAFGDGIMAYGCQNVVVQGCIIANSSRAGLSSFGSAVFIANTDFNCNVIELDGEMLNGVNYQIDDGGGNVCHCGDAFIACQIKSKNLQPPDVVVVDP